MTASSTPSTTHTQTAYRGLPLPQTLLIIVLTVIYLLVEMAFNASLLDVAGGLESSRVDSLERYGRMLSGAAVALFVLQYLLGRRVKSVKSGGQHAPHVLSIVFWCLLSVVLTYGALKLITDALVHSTSAQYRKASANLMLVRSEMLGGRALIAGLADSPDFFKQPEGKAFAALFPALGAMIWPKLDKTLAPVKAELFYKATDSSIGGPQAFYNGPYKEALQQMAQMHRGNYPDEVFTTIYRHEADKLWAQYEADLKARHWTPSTVPYMARSRVVAEMGKRAGVPKNWHPSDRITFNIAVMSKVKSSLQNNPGAIYEDGRVVASGLSWPAYVAHPAMQRELQKKFSLPASVPVLAVYGSGEEFESRLYRHLVRASADKEMARLNLSAEQYKAPGPHAREGFEAAQGSLVPPIALWFSLLGAISHLAKLLYQVTRLATMYIPVNKCTRWLPAAVPLFTVSAIALLMATNDTSATASSPHQFLKRQAMAASTEGGSVLQTQLIIGVMHAVEVGQSYAYPINNFIRKKVLWDVHFELPRERASAAKASVYD